MASVKIKKKKIPTANLPSQMNPQSMIGANLTGAQPVPKADLMGSQPVPSADLMGAQPVPSANLMGSQPVPKADGLSQQIDAMEMTKPVSTAAPMPKPKAKVKTKKQKDPPGTFRNADGELVIGDMKTLQAWKNKK